jgi:hypothetical protein
MAFGVGAGAFLQGLQGGMGLYTKFQDAQDRATQREALGAAATEARTARDADIAGAVTAVPGADGQPGSFRVGDHTFATQEEANKVAEGQVGSFMDYYRRVGAPRVLEGYLQSGDPDKAAAFGKWMDTEGSRSGMRSWAQAMRAAQWGDADGFARHMTAAYNNQDYFGDGHSVGRAEVTRDAQGKATGMNLTIRDRNGGERTQSFTGMNDVYRAGLSFLSPDKAFEALQAEAKAAQTARLSLATEDRRFGRQVALQRDSQNFQIEQGNTAEQRAVAREGRTEDRLEGREGRQEERQVAREGRAQRDRLEGQNNESMLRRAERDAGGAAPTQDQVQRSLSSIQGQLANSLTLYPSTGPDGKATRVPFSALPTERQVEEARKVYEAQRAQAARVAGSTRTQERGVGTTPNPFTSGGRGVTVYTP